MTHEQIAQALDAKTPVHWANDGYSVIKDSLDRVLVVYASNGYTTPLVDTDLTNCYTKGSICML